MILTKIREHLSVALALAAAIFAAYAYITNLHYKNLEAKMEVVEERNSILTTTNASQHGAIQDLIRQRQVDDKVLAWLEDIEREVTRQTRDFNQDIEELAENEPEANDYLNTPINPDVARVLTADDLSDATDPDDPTGKAPERLSPSTPGELRGQEEPSPGGESQSVEGRGDKMQQED